MFVVVDVETTGLDPHKDFLLELGIVLTREEPDRDLEILDEVSWTVYVPFVQTTDMDDVVREMHTKSGLLDECSKSPAMMLEDIEEAALDFLNGAAGLPMCGSSVHFDRAFLKENLPKFESMFHYRNIDTSTVKNLAEMWCPEVFEARPQGQKLHRAIPDCHDTIEELRHYKEMIFDSARPY